MSDRNEMTGFFFSFFLFFMTHKLKIRDLNSIYCWLLFLSFFLGKILLFTGRWKWTIQSELFINFTFENATGSEP